jgi:hypothetical protein
MIISYPACTISNFKFQGGSLSIGVHILSSYHEDAGKVADVSEYMSLSTDSTLTMDPARTSKTSETLLRSTTCKDPGEESTLSCIIYVNNSHTFLHIRL